MNILPIFRIIIALAVALAGAIAAYAAPPAQDITPSPTPFVMPTPAATPTPVCPQVTRNRLILYERGRVTEEDPSPLNIREGAGTSFNIVGSIPSGEVFFVLEGPQCSQRYAWYRVRYQEIDGWIAEGTGNIYYVEPYLPG